MPERSLGDMELFGRTRHVAGVQDRDEVFELTEIQGTSW
jgi:hypothetical protein